MPTAHRLVSPRARLVLGDAFKGSDKDNMGRPRTTLKGEPKIQYFIGIAVPKTDPGAQTMIDTLRTAAAEGFRNGEQNSPAFSWKYEDGDSTVPNSKGKIPCERPGWAGCWVFKFSTSFPPTVYDESLQQIVDPRRIKRGDYVRVSGTTKANTGEKPGVYLSHDMIQFVAQGEEIRSGPSAVDVFGGGGAAAPVPAPSTPPAPAPTPAPGFGTAPPPPAPPAPPSTPAMAPSCPYTYQQLLDQGWTEEQMRSAGHLA